jgi:uncharacterized protein YcbX
MVQDILVEPKNAAPHTDSSTPDDFQLGIEGFTYGDLYRPARLRALAEAFYAEVGAEDPALGDALSEYVGQPLRLVMAERPGNAVDRGRGRVTMVSEASLAELARHAGRDAVDARRFRMLIGVDGCGPHEEDEWLGGRVRLGEAVVELYEQVARCAITTQNPDTGARDLDTLRTIRDYRGLRDGEALDFGVFGDVVEPGRVSVGDAVEPLQ